MNTLFSTRHWRRGLGAALLLLPCWAAAQTGPQNTQVSAAVANGCPSVTVTPLDFGDHLQANVLVGVDAPLGYSTIKVVCGVNTPYSIALDPGLYPSNGRRMKRSGPVASNHYLPYVLYKQPGAASKWGNNTATYGTDEDEIGDASEQPKYVYARFTNSFQAPPGEYTDSVQVIVTF